MDATILGIETSCDETAAAVVRNGRTILSNIVLSQIADHAVFGGVVPEVASRKHLETIIPVVDEAVRGSGVALGDIDAIAVTYGPGLVGALLVGLSFAKGIAKALDIPLIGVHHVAAHILAANLMDEPPEPPFTALIVSGGHSSIFYVKNFLDFSLLGRTRDDAAGEAFDKVARATGLGYPGGPKLEAAAVGGAPEAVRFPRTSFKDGSFDFSFSGVKTAALNYLKKEQAVIGGADANHSDGFYKDFYASYQAAVVDALVTNTIAAEKSVSTGKIVVAGGVAANGALRERFYAAASAANIAANSVSVAANTANAAVNDGRLKIYFPPPALCTDNAAMVAAKAYYDYAAGAFSPLTLNASPTAAL